MSRINRIVSWGRANPVAGGASAVAAVVGLAFLSLKPIVDTSAASPFGVITGVMAALTMTSVMAYSWRRSRPQVRSLGPARRYLELHLWGGGLFAFLLLVHVDFSLPGSGLGWTLWGFSVWVALTGALGVALQRTLPRALNSASSFEVNLARAPELVAQLRERAAELVSAAEQPLRLYHQAHVAPELAALTPRWPVIGARPTGDGGEEVLRRTLSEGGVATLNALLAVREQKREIDAHAGIQQVLRGWMVLHIPVAIALLVVVAIHILLNVYY